MDEQLFLLPCPSARWFPGAAGGVITLPITLGTPVPRDLLAAYPDPVTRGAFAPLGSRLSLHQRADGSWLAQAVSRMRIVRVSSAEGHLLAEVSTLPALPAPEPEQRGTLVDLLTDIIEQVHTLAALSGVKLTSVTYSAEPATAATTLAEIAQAVAPLAPAESLAVFLADDLLSLAHALRILLVALVRRLTYKTELNQDVRTQLDARWRRSFLHEQLAQIQAELRTLEGEPSGAAAYTDLIARLPLPAAEQDQLREDVARWEQLSPGSVERDQLQRYLDTVTALPWGVASPPLPSLEVARTLLAASHHGLETLNARILEDLAVRHLNPGAVGAVLCLVGPPGVGKTQIADTIARLYARPLVTIALGGVADEAEIRGHRRTYAGALMGRIASGITRAGTLSPVLLLDEIDKLRSGAGDPAAALLEVLDPHAQRAFRDHYLDLPLDLSGVIFLATANTAETISPALRDRLDVIALPGYTTSEKKIIARDFLLPRLSRNAGLPDPLVLDDDLLRDLITTYTREAGVRQLEHRLAALVRANAVAVLAGEPFHLSVFFGGLAEHLGPPPYRPFAHRDAVPGTVLGLAWTEAGGAVLPLEAAVLDGGSGQLVLTGRLGQVMSESAQAALTAVRTHLVTAGLRTPAYFGSVDLHLHAPEGNLPKEGPSAGVAIACALWSAITGIAPRVVAMTGEITLSGRILPVGGLKEKLLAADAAGISEVLVPADNVPDITPFFTEIEERITIRPGATLADYLAVAFPDDSDGLDREA